MNGARGLALCTEEAFSGVETAASSAALCSGEGNLPGIFAPDTAAAVHPVSDLSARGGIRCYGVRAAGCKEERAEQCSAEFLSRFHGSTPHTKPSCLDHPASCHRYRIEV